jgi:purine-nucleoside phosphorylase
MAPDVPTTTFAPTLEAIRSKLPEKLQNPTIGIICGSGLSGLVDTLREAVIIQYDDIPGFGRSTGTVIYQGSAGILS